jgi:hypothetical protein
MKIPRLLLTAALAGCAAAPAVPQWQKPGTSRAVLDEDLRVCRAEARLATPVTPRTSSDSSSTSPMLDRQEDMSDEESGRVNRCMTNKGYSLAR